MTFKLLLTFCLLGFSAIGMAQTNASSSEKLTAKNIGNKLFLGVHLGDLQTVNSPHAVAGKQGLTIRQVMLGMGAETAGLKANDLIIEYDDFDFSAIEGKASSFFTNYIRREKKVGERIQLKIYRLQQSIVLQEPAKSSDKDLTPTELTELLQKQSEGESLNIQANKNPVIFEVSVPLLGGSNYLSAPPPKNAQLFPQYEGFSDKYTDLMHSLVKEQQLQAPYDDLMQRYATDQWWDDGQRLSLFRYLHRDPLKVAPVMEKITQQLLQQSHQPIQLLSQVSALLDAPIPNNKTTELSAPQSNQFEDHIAFIKQLIAASVKARQQAFANLSEADQTFLYEQGLKLPGDYFHNRWDANSSSAEFIDFQKLLSLGRKIDYSALAQSAQLIAQLSNDVWLANFKAIAAQFAKDHQGEFQQYTKQVGAGKIIYFEELPSGNLVILDQGDNEVSKSVSYLIDIGGNDHYRNNAGGAFDAQHPVSFLIDYAGEDNYASTSPVSQGSGFVGVGLLLDLQGDDIYISNGYAQGFSLFGVGLLIDVEGNDRYHGQEGHQGVGMWGLGLHLDLQGNDAYHAHFYAQGFGAPKGIGLLLDNSGNDFYYAKGKHQSAYGTSGVYSGFSQGAAFGLRRQASGGMGFLLDKQGKDRFEAGNFSQGTGYFFGMGVLRNSGEEDDRYYGSRYTQSASAHSAIGVLIEDGGDDYYSGILGASQSAAWDLAASVLIDKQGDDTYYSENNSFSIGAAAHNGFAIFIDEHGDDSYRLPKKWQKRATQNGYHGGSSFAFFLDADGEDKYWQDHFKNNHQHLEGEYGFMVDQEVESSVEAFDFFDYDN